MSTDGIAAWIHVRADGAVDVFTGKAELGQNIRTSLTQAVADELRVPVGRVTMVMADTEQTPFEMGTFGSRTTPYMAPQLRRAAAAARQVLLEIAAARWGVDPIQVEADEGRVVHRPSGRTIGYGELTDGKPIAQVIGATPPTIADRTGWRVAGTRETKVNARDFVTGRHQFPSDITRPGLLHGAIVRPPSLGATLDDPATAVIPAGTDARLVRDAAFLGVVASNATTARTLAAGVTARWGPPAHPAADAALFDDLRRTAERKDPVFESGFAGDRTRRGSLARRCRLYGRLHRPRAARASRGRGRVVR